MKRKYLSVAIGSVLLSSAIAAPAAWAQDPPAAPAEQQARATTLGTVTVSARKREETLQEVPVAVTAFTAEALDKLAIDDLGDLDAQVPNLTIYAARGSSSTVTAYIRGIGQADPLWGVDPGVGIYLDDVYIARPQGALLDVFDVQRVEVLRGPQGTLYGKNTIGGAIKYISRGLPAETTGFGSLTVGNYNQLDARAAIGGTLGSDALRARVAVASLNRDGFGDNQYTDQEVSDKEILAARGQVGAWIGEDFDVQVAFDWMDDQSGVRGAKMLAPNAFTALFPAFGANPPLDDRYDIRSGMRNVNDTSMTGASITANWRATEDWVFKYVLARRESDTETNIDFDTTPAPIVDVKAFYEDEQVSHELQANFDAGGRARGVMGVYAFDGEAGGQVLNNFLNASFGDTEGTVFTDSLAFYADWTFDLTQRLKLDVGARYTDEDKRAVVLNRAYTDGTFTTPRATVADFDKTTNFKNVSPKVSLDYQVTDGIMLYGLATRGFKSGGYNIRANAVAVPRSAEPFDDEKVDSLEIGSKMAFLDNSLFLNLAYFHNDYEDIQLSVFTAFDSNGDGVDDAFFGDFTNAGKGTVQGVEAEYQWLVGDHWVLGGNLAWLDAQYDEFITREVNVADAQRFTNAPEFSGAVNLEYRTALSGGGDLSTRLGYSYQSEVWPTTDLSPAIRQEGYGLLNAGIIWKLDDAWSFSLQGTNLLDEEYRTTGYNIPVLGVLTGFYGPPRQYALTVRYDF
ncbi:TonB-dependent receptor [Agrilutibacter solisilvae]|uniref:TonB-dependent receptor n=1 Tax=Agrilutibacter solisilvae TaxID=2763317 RepID=A0A975ATB3_9GAMM|nr:TonB-dependent receptor [Lysobacter solisilvae]QSX79118.1 TonB-dependent receptor [Lysobacter solisilvae]